MTNEEIKESYTTLRMLNEFMMWKYNQIRSYGRNDERTKAERCTQAF